MKLDKKAFETWLSEHPFSEFTVCSDRCPLARYLTDSGLEKATVGLTHYYYGPKLHDPGRTPHELPVWAFNFREAFDDAGANARVQGFNGRQALEILKEVDLA